MLEGYHIQMGHKSCPALGVSSWCVEKLPKVCAAGVPQMLTDAHKEAIEEITTGLCTVQEVRVFCPKLSKGHEIGVHCFELKSIKQLMEWCLNNIPKEGGIHGLHCHLEKSWLQSLGMRSVLVL